MMVNENQSNDPFGFLGKILETFMEVEMPYSFPDPARWEAQRERVRKMLAKHGLAYKIGGRIAGGNVTLPTSGLEELIRSRDFVAVEQELNRGIEMVETDPPAAVTAACAVLEALAKIYLADEGLPVPGKQDARPLWKELQDHLGLDPGSVEDADLKRILVGLASIVDGISALRTHAGTAHGRGRKSYRLAPRHARLAIHAAHTLVHFLIETWDDRRSARKATKAGQT